MASTRTGSSSEPNKSEVAEYMVRSLDGTAHHALYAVPRSGVIYEGNKWTIEAAETPDYDQLYNTCFGARDELIAAARRYCEKRKLPALDFEVSNDWSTVEDSLTAACEKLEELAKDEKKLTGISGRLRGAYRKFCEHAGVGAALCSLIPDDFMCAATLRGGLKMIFEALQQSYSYGEEVYRALEDIPFIVNQHAPYIDMYRMDKDLHMYNSSLHASIFRLLQLLLLWFSESRAVATIKLGFNPKRFSDRLKERIAEVKIAETRFEKHASLLQNRENRDLHQRTTVNLQSFEHKLFIERLARLDCLENFALGLQLKQQDWERKLVEIHRSISPNPRQAIAEAEEIRKQILIRNEYNPALMRSDCTSLLNVRGRLARDDLEEERITAIRLNPRLLAWLILDESSMLLLDGNTERPTNNETSFIVARVVEGALDFLEQRESDVKAVPLAFFCGCHRFAGRGTVAQMVLSLLLTLVDLYREFDATTLQECLERTDAHDFLSILDSLERLIFRLPPGVIVLLVIDGLRCFSQPLHRSREMYETMARLIGIYRKGPKATLKILFASALRSDPIHSLLWDDEILHIPKDLPSRGGYGGTRWNSKIAFSGM
ncbi:hypothetical protein GGR53DRAFT_498243 [Hypoxylon sp. FL1150]|nr:hypothetical protein GGR53DRAFT_498243 [Hypoxylon sp. FL1150]